MNCIFYSVAVSLCLCTQQDNINKHTIEDIQKYNITYTWRVIEVLTFEAMGQRGVRLWGNFRKMTLNRIGLELSLFMSICKELSHWSNVSLGRVFR